MRRGFVTGCVAAQGKGAVPSQPAASRSREPEPRGIPLPRPWPGSPVRRSTAGRRRRRTSSGSTGTWNATMYQLRRAWSPCRIAQAIARWCGVDSTVRLLQPLGVPLGERPGDGASPVVARRGGRATRPGRPQRQRRPRPARPSGRPGARWAGRRGSSRAGRAPPPAGRPRRAAASTRDQACRSCGQPCSSTTTSSPTPLSLTSNTRPSRVNRSTPRTYPRRRLPRCGGSRRMGACRPSTSTTCGTSRQRRTPVFDALADVERYAAWWPQVRTAERIDDEAGRTDIRSFLPYTLAPRAAARDRGPQRRAPQGRGER